MVRLRVVEGAAELVRTPDLQDLKFDPQRPGCGLKPTTLESRIKKLGLSRPR